MGLVAGWLLLVAMALPGVALLRRWTRLDPLESFAYGSVLGVVGGSTAWVVVASVLGPSAWQILAIAVAGAGLGAMLFAGAPRHAAPGDARRAAMSPAAFLVLGLFTLRWAMLASSALTVDERGLWAGHLHVWGDWSQHLGDVTAFAFGDNFPPTHPRFAGHPLSYHYLTSVTVAAMVRLGLSPLTAMPIHSFAFMTLVTLSVFAFARRLGRDAGVATLALALFLLGSGLGWWISVRDALATPDPWGAFWADPWDRAAQAAANLRWQDAVFAYLLPQRAVLYGWPLGLLALTQLFEGGREGGRRPFVVAGLAAGLLPLAHLGTMLGLALITPFLALAFPRRGWIWFFAIWAALASPVFLLHQGGGGGVLAHVRWQIGWVAAPDPWWLFWLKNLGAFLPLLVGALAAGHVVPPPGRRFLAAFMPTFVVANLVVFQPWDWDNTKVFEIWFLGGCVLVAAWLTRLARRGGIPRAAAIALVVSQVLSACFVHLDQALGRDRVRMLSTEELRLADEVRRRTPPRALFLAGLQHNHSVPMLAGRRVVSSYRGWMWSQGLADARRAADVKAMYALGPEGEAKLASYGVDFVVIGPWEREHFHPDEPGFDARFRRALEVPPYVVYATRAPR
jgi:hypothetical protein